VESYYGQDGLGGVAVSVDTSRDPAEIERRLRGEPVLSGAVDEDSDELEQSVERELVRKTRLGGES
jgi:hypothetical protein